MLLTVISSSFTRPADTVAYAIGDLVANADGAFYLQGGTTNPYSIPLGGFLPYIGASAANSAFALPYGQAISRTTYATLFSLVGTTFGSGDGSTTFNLPDLRGRVIAGLDNMGGSSAARLSTVMTSTGMGNTGGAQNQSIGQGNLPNVSFPVTDTHFHHSIFSAGTVGFAAGVGYATVTNSGTGGAFGVMWNGGAIDLGGTLTSTTIGGSITVGSGGSGTALNTTQPTMVANFILRII